MLKLSNGQWQFIKYLNGRINNAPFYQYKFNQWFMKMIFLPRMDRMCRKISFKVSGITNVANEEVCRHGTVDISSCLNQDLYELL